MRFILPPEFVRPGSAYLLFGSVARGEARRGSDIDLLELTDAPAPSPPPSLPPSLSIHRYSRARLTSLFEGGSLFALHLQREGRILHDPEGELERIGSEPVHVDFERLNARLRSEIRVLHAYDLDLTLRTTQSVVRHLLRTAAFAECARRGQPSFSASVVAMTLGLPTLERLLRGDALGDVAFNDEVADVLDALVRNPPARTHWALGALATAGGYFARQLTSAPQGDHTLVYEPEIEATSVAA